MRDETIEKFKSSGVNKVWIDDSLGEGSDFSLPVDRRNEIPSVDVEAEIERVRFIYQDTISTMKRCIEDAKLGRSIKFHSVESMVIKICESIERNGNALLLLARLKSKNPDLIERSVSSSVIAAAFAWYLGYQGDEWKQIVLGALFLDVGKVHIPNNILQKPESLNEEEWSKVKLHVDYGQRILKVGEANEISLAMCALHHERFCGDGYPGGLGESSINMYGRIAGIIDTYDAITTDRAYKKSVMPSEALKELLGLVDFGLDRELVYEFIRCLGIYPVGSIVELSNGKLGIVVATNFRFPDKPIVKIIYNIKQKCYESPSVVDLTKIKSSIAIVCSHEASAYGINVEDFV